MTALVFGRESEIATVFEVVTNGKLYTVTEAALHQFVSSGNISKAGGSMSPQKGFHPLDFSLPKRALVLFVVFFPVTPDPDLPLGRSGVLLAGFENQMRGYFGKHECTSFDSGPFLKTPFL